MIRKRLGKLAEATFLVRAKLWPLAARSKRIVTLTNKQTYDYYLTVAKSPKRLNEGNVVTQLVFLKTSHLLWLGSDITSGNLP